MSPLVVYIRYEPSYCTIYYYILYLTYLLFQKCTLVINLCVLHEDIYNAFKYIKDGLLVHRACVV